MLVFEFEVTDKIASFKLQSKITSPLLLGAGGFGLIEIWNKSENNIHCSFDRLSANSETFAL